MYVWGWCILMWVSAHDTCENMHEAATGQPRVLFLRCHPSCFWDRVSLAWNLWIRLGCTGSRLHGSTCLPLQLGITSVQHDAQLSLCRLWGLNSCPHACLADTLPTELSPQHFMKWEGFWSPFYRWEHWASYNLCNVEEAGLRLELGSF